MDNNTEVTVSDTTVEDRFEVETNVVPEAEPAKVEPEKDKTTEVETPATEPKAEPTEPKPINPRTAQRKAEKERLLTENATMREQLRQLTQERAPASEQPKARDLSKEPNIQDYDDAVEYTRDVARYDRKQEALQESLQKQTEALAERAEAVRAEKPDFDEKIEAIVQSQLVTPDIEKAILASPIGADIMYHLGNYGSDLLTLRGLPPESLPQAIKAIEAFIKNGGEQQEKPRITKAEPPITPPGVTKAGDRSLSSYSQEELEQMPMSEFKRLSKMK
jgi:hypothetical protein